MLDGGQMNLFRKLARRPETKKIQTVTENEVQEVLQYMEGLPLPHPNKTLKLELLDGRNLTRRCRPAVKAQWYLLVFDEEGQGAFNAGYVLKQGQELLRARRIATKILRQIPEEAGRPQLSWSFGNRYEACVCCRCQMGGNGAFSHLSEERRALD